MAVLMAAICALVFPTWRVLLPAMLCYPSPMSEPASQYSTSSLKLLPAYRGTASIDDALRTVRGQRVLWLEILVNDQLDLTALAI